MVLEKGGGGGGGRLGESYTLRLWVTGERNISKKGALRWTHSMVP